MLKISVELTQSDPIYGDLIPRFLGDFRRISEALSETVEMGGLWNEADGFFCDVLQHGNEHLPVRVRSLVGIIPLLASCTLNVQHLQGIVTEDDQNVLDIFKAETEQSKFIQIRGDLVYLSTVDKLRLERVLSYLTETEEFLSPFGIRSLSKYYQDHPYIMEIDKTVHSVEFCPGESTSNMFGGNSNWRGPVWFPMNYLILQALETAHSFYGDSLLCRLSSAGNMTLRDFTTTVRKRLISIFLPDSEGKRPCHGEEVKYMRDEGWRDKVLFYEYFHSETGRGCGASHQTGWTALVIELILDSYKT